jgi:hypothetical protein
VQPHLCYVGCGQTQRKLGTDIVICPRSNPFAKREFTSSPSVSPLRIGAQNLLRSSAYRILRPPCATHTCVQKHTALCVQHCPFARKWEVVFVDPGAWRPGQSCHQKCVRKEISRPGFLNVNRYSVLYFWPR